MQVNHTQQNITANTIKSMPPSAVGKIDNFVAIATTTH